MRVPGLILEEIRKLANMYVFFDTVGYAADSAPLREGFDVQAQTLEEWASKVSRPLGYGKLSLRDENTTCFGSSFRPTGSGCAAGFVAELHHEA
jgi:hypothetical protein